MQLTAGPAAAHPDSSRQGKAAAPGPAVRIRTWCENTADHGGGIVTVAIIAPVTILLFLGLLQAVLFYHARSLASISAEEALKQASAQYGSAPAGIAAGYAFIATAGPTSLRAPVVTATRSRTTATADVTGLPPILVPFLTPNLTVHVHMERPVERITTPGEVG